MPGADAALAEHSVAALVGKPHDVEVVVEPLFRPHLRLLGHEDVAGVDVHHGLVLIREVLVLAVRIQLFGHEVPDLPVEPAEVDGLAVLDDRVVVLPEDLVHHVAVDEAEGFRVGGQRVGDILVPVCPEPRVQVRVEVYAKEGLRRPHRPGNRLLEFLHLLVSC